jgi:hypothetical protein
MPRELTPEEVMEVLDETLDDEIDAARSDIFSKAIETKPWSELEIVEHQGYLYFPDQILRRRKDGKFESVPIRVRVPRLVDNRKARIRAHELAAQEGIDLKRDPLEFASLETICNLWRAVRSPTPPYESLTMDELELERTYEEDSLTLVAKRMNFYREQLNPHVKKLTRSDYMALLSSISERRDVSPLVGIDGATQNAFIVTTALLLRSLMTAPSSSPSSETSTPDSSTPESSGSSSAEGPPDTTS